MMVYWVGRKIQLVSAILLLLMLLLVQPSSAGRRKSHLMVKRPIQTHRVLTKDGYILSLHRIVGRINSKPVYIQHGLRGSSNDWIISAKRSLPYILAKRGYDVWIGNARGNIHSKKHKYYEVTDQRFWNFSWQEMGEYDLPAVISYIKNKTGQNIFYIGHSMGATMFSVMAIEKPEIAKKVKAAFLLAPATYISHMKSPGKVISSYWPEIWNFAKSIGMYEFLPRSSLFDMFSQFICADKLLERPLCGIPLLTMAGFDPQQLDKSVLDKIWKNFSASTSTKLFIHMLQQVSGNDFHKFDYGHLENVRIYKSGQPPRYDISKIKVPVAVYWSENDLFVGQEDAHRFYNETPNKLGIYKINDTQFNHFDFLWGTNAPDLVYYTIVDRMTSFK